MFPLIWALALAGGALPGDPVAAPIGLKAHADAGALQRLPRFDYQARYRWGYVEAMRAEVKAGLPELARALDGETSRKPGEGIPWREFGLAWDETRLIIGTRPIDTDLGGSFRFGTRAGGWHRNVAEDGSRVQFCRTRNVGLYWWAGGSDPGAIVESAYLRLPPQKWWWGESSRRTNQALTHQPLAGASWARLPAEPFAGEPCDAVEVSGKYGRFQRLWVGRTSGRVRGVLSFYSGPDDFNSLVRFDDYQEVAPGVWVPAPSLGMAHPLAALRFLDRRRRSSLVVGDGVFPALPVLLGPHQELLPWEPPRRSCRRSFR